ncbi:Uncharacterised protein [Vibrio cholerae]|nr:Uncharacterised protein [Vibrio cholerae]
MLSITVSVLIKRTIKPISCLTKERRSSEERARF